MSLDYYSNFANASTNGKKGASFYLGKGAVTPIYWASANCEKLVKNCTQGAFLAGTMTVTKVIKLRIMPAPKVVLGNVFIGIVHGVVVVYLYFTPPTPSRTLIPKKT